MKITTCNKGLIAITTNTSNGIMITFIANIAHINNLDIIYNSTQTQTSCQDMRTYLCYTIEHSISALIESCVISWTFNYGDAKLC